MSEWQPIETAPKDGTEIIYWSKHLCRPMMAFYSEGHIWMGGLAYHPSAIPREWEDVATHWMPMPGRPVGADQWKSYFEIENRAIAGGNENDAAKSL